MSARAVNGTRRQGVMRNMQDKKSFNLPGSSSINFEVLTFQDRNVELRFGLFTECLDELKMKVRTLLNINTGESKEVRMRFVPSKGLKLIETIRKQDKFEFSEVTLNEEESRPFKLCVVAAVERVLDGFEKMVSKQVRSSEKEMLLRVFGNRKVSFLEELLTLYLQCVKKTKFNLAAMLLSLGSFTYRSVFVGTSLFVNCGLSEMKVEPYLSEFSGKDGSQDRKYTYGVKHLDDDISVRTEFYKDLRLKIESKPVKNMKQQATVSVDFDDALSVIIKDERKVGKELVKVEGQAGKESVKVGSPIITKANITGTRPKVQIESTKFMNDDIPQEVNDGLSGGNGFEKRLGSQPNEGEYSLSPSNKSVQKINLDNLTPRRTVATRKLVGEMLQNNLATLRMFEPFLVDEIRPLLGLEDIQLVSSKSVAEFVNAVGVSVAKKDELKGILSQSLDMINFKRLKAKLYLNKDLDCNEVLKAFIGTVYICLYDHDSGLIDNFLNSSDNVSAWNMIIVALKVAIED